jgi:hypothetical protein
VSRGFAIEASMASMATPVAVAAMQVGGDKHDLQRAIRPVHQVNKVRQHGPLGQLEHEVIETITSGQ